MLELETVDTLWTTVVPLTREDLEAVARLGAQNSQDELKNIRTRHHRVAKMLALGKSKAEAARATGLTFESITRIANSPAFENLVLHYVQELDDSMDELFERMHTTSLQLLDEIQDRLDNPKEMEDTELKDLVKAFSDLVDRVGYSPVQKVQQASVHIDSEFLREIRDAQGGRGSSLRGAHPPALVRPNPAERFAGKGEEF